MSGKGFRAARSTRSAAARATAPPARRPARWARRRRCSARSHTPLHFAVQSFVVNDTTLGFYVNETHRHPGAGAAHGQDHRRGSPPADHDPVRAAPAGGRRRRLAHRRSSRRSPASVGKHYIVSSVGCKNRKHKFSAEADVQRAGGRRHGAGPARLDERPRRAPSSARSGRSAVSDGPASAGPSPFLDSSAVLVFAHGIVGRADLPIPEALFVAAAAAVLVVSFAALAATWSEPRLQRWPERRLFRLPAAADVVLGLLGVACSAVTAYAGLAGTETERENLAPWMVYVAFWVGVPCASLLARRRLAAAEPVARDRPRGRLARGALRGRRAAGAAGLSRAARALAGGRRRDRVRHLRAVLGDRARARAARRADARLRRGDAGRDEPLRRRGVDAQRGCVRRLLRPVRRAGSARAARRRAATPARRSSAPG